MFSTKKQKTWFPKPHEVKRNWWIVDAEGKVLGRLVSKIAQIIMGKHKKEYTPHVDVGDFVIVVNADKVILKGKRAQLKKYYRHSGWAGGLKTKTFGELVKNKPHIVFEEALWGMLPRNRMRNRMMKRMKVYAGANHPHTAQKPVELKV